jgi:hypothetical protein
MIVEYEYTSGQKREVQPEDCLGLVLVWTRTRGSLNVIELVFGLIYFTLSVYLRFGMRLFNNTFWNDPLARVSIPLAEDIKNVQSSFCRATPPFEQLLGNNGWPETIFANNSRKRRYPETLL